MQESDDDRNTRPELEFTGSAKKRETKNNMEDDGREDRSSRKNVAEK